MFTSRCALPFFTLSAGTLLCLLFLSFVACAQEPAPDEDVPLAMTAERLGELIVKVDPDAELSGSTWSFQVSDLDVAVIYDVPADRMRIISPIGPADTIPADELMRLMQANFDSALDARYGIAQDQLWGTFIHPLSELSDEEFLVALGQTLNVVLTYGTTYSSGLLIFGGGDSEELQRRALIESLKETI